MPQHPDQPEPAPLALPAVRLSPGAYQFLVAMRYLRRNWLSWLAVVGVALSVLVLIVVLSVMTGFDEELRARIRGTLSDLIVESAYEETFGDYEEVMANLEALPGVVAAAPHLDGLALIRLGTTGDQYRWGQFSGIDIERETAATNFAEYWREGMKESALTQVPLLLERLQIVAGNGEAEATLRRYLELAANMAAGITPEDYGTLTDEERAAVESWAEEAAFDLEAARREFMADTPPGEIAEESRARLERLRQAVPRVKDYVERVKEEVSLLRGSILETAAHLGPDGMAELPKEYAAWLRDLAAERGVDLAEQWAGARPNWGPPNLLRREGEAPVIAGRDVLVLGRDEAGGEVIFGVGQPLVVIAPVDWDDRAVKSCRVAGKIKSGMYEYDSRQIYLPLDVAQHMLRRSGRVSSVNVRLEDYGEAMLARSRIMGLLTPDEVAAWARLLGPDLQREAGRAFRTESGETLTFGDIKEELAEGVALLRAEYAEWMATGNPRASRLIQSLTADLEELTAMLLEGADARTAERLGEMADLLEERREGGLGGGFRVWTWEDKRRNTLRAVWLERRIMTIILFLLVLVAGFVILAILHTSVITKTRDIGILKAMGATPRGIMSLFVLNGVLIGVMGAALGSAGGVWLCANLAAVEDVIFRWFRFQVFPRDVYSLDQIPTASDPALMIFVIAASAVAVAFFSSLYPAWRAARLAPVEAIRYE